MNVGGLPVGPSFPHPKPVVVLHLDSRPIDPRNFLPVIDVTHENKHTTN